MKCRNFLIFLLSTTLILEGNGLKILGIFPAASRSHFAIGDAIIETLHNAGHEVTVMSPFRKGIDSENYHEIDASNVLNVHKTTKREVNPFIFGQFPAIKMIHLILKRNADVVDLFMSNPQVQKFMKEDNQFDVCIFERFLFDSLLGVAEKTNCVVIDYVAFPTVTWIDEITGNISPTSYVPNPYLEYADNMTFKGRLWNTVVSIVEKGLYRHFYLPKHREFYAKHFPNATRSFDEMHESSSIIFSSFHISTARPYMPNVIEIGGIHVKKPKALPKDIQRFLDSATDGVILFTMGSFIQSKQWPEEKRDAFVRAFGRLKQKVLWKYENETLPGNPGNIMIGSWLPQRDILAHPNVKLFITHGGGLGGTEAIVEGVPLLGIPIYGDHRFNMAIIEKKGFGLTIDYHDVTEGNLSKAINEVLNNPKYKQNAMKMSKRFKDRPMTVEESVVYWTEYAARHDGADFLKGQGLYLNVFQLYSIDVFAALFVGLFAILYTQFVIARWTFRKIATSSTDKKIKKS